MKQIYYQRRNHIQSTNFYIASFLVGSIVLAAGMMSLLLTTSPNIASAQEMATSTTDVTVTIVKFIEGTMATASSSHGMEFNMEATWNSENLGAGTGAYSLSASGYNSDPTPYQAITSPMTSGADYSTYEVMGSDVSTTCDSEHQFSLVGYSTGDTLTSAMTALVSAQTPAFSDLTTSKFVIVWNNDCDIIDSDTDGTVDGIVIGGASADGALQVTSIDQVNTTATANDSYANGWVYRFHITVPQTETAFSMRFSDWVHTNTVSLLPVAGNMRISTLQASSTAPITLTGSNVYSNPNLHLITDLDPTTPGRQIEVLVEVKIPTSTVNGNYSTTYGVRSLAE